MATVNNQNNQEDQTNLSGPTPVAGTGGAPSGSGTGKSGVSGGANQSPVQQNSAAQNQSGYTDVGSYLNANQAGSSQMGQDVAGNLTNQYNQTKQGVAQSANDLINQTNQGYTKENTDLIKQVAADPNAAANNAGTLAQFQGQLNDTYAGPTSWGDYGAQQGNVANAQQYGSLANTPGGLNVYAQQLEGQKGTGQTSQGINQLDSLLLQGSPDAQASIKAAADPYATLGDYLNQQNTAATGAIQAGQTGAQNASQDALNAFTGDNGTLTNLNSQINQTTAKALSDATAGNAKLKTDLTSGNMDEADLKAAGITGDQWNTLKAAMTRANTSQYMTGHNFGAASATQALDPNEALQQQDPTKLINNGTTATPEQYQQMASIQALLGGKNPQGNALNPALASLAGTYNPSQLNQFDAPGYQQYATNVGDAERQAAQEQANALTAAADAQHAASKSHTLGQNFLNNIGKPLAKYFVNPLGAVKDEFGATKTGYNKLTGGK